MAQGGQGGAESLSADLRVALGPVELDERLAGLGAMGVVGQIGEERRRLLRSEVRDRFAGQGGGLNVLRGQPAQARLLLWRGRRVDPAALPLPLAMVSEPEPEPALLPLPLSPPPFFLPQPNARDIASSAIAIRIEPPSRMLP